MKPVPLSAVVIAKNEERNIERCLKSLEWCSEVVLVDDDSDDNTRAVAESLGARVIRHEFTSFAQQRNWALEHAGLRHPWVLMLDADEAMTPLAAEEVSSALEKPDHCVAGFLMCRKTMFLNQWLRYSDGFPVWIMRLVHRNRAKFVDSGHGEVPAPPVDGQLARIREPFLHFPFSHGLSHWVARHNVYSSREAGIELRDLPSWTWREILGGDGPQRRRAIRNLGRNAPFRMVLRFCYHYLWRRGILDGRAGLAFSLLMAGYEGMIVLKRWEEESRSKHECLVECTPNSGRLGSPPLTTVDPFV